MEKIKTMCAFMLTATLALVTSGCSLLKYSIFSLFTPFTHYESYEQEELYSSGDLSYSDEAGIDSINVSWIAGGIEIITVSDGDGVYNIHENSDSLSDPEKVHCYIDGSTIYVKYCESGYKGDIDSKKKKLTIEIPEGINVKIESVSAGVKSDSVIADNISIETVSGDIRIAALNASEVKLNTVSGIICVAESAVDYQIDAESISGNIEIKSVSADRASYKTVSGNVDIKLMNECSTQIKTVSGRVTLSLDEAVGADIVYSTTSGTMHTNLAHDEFDENHIIIGDGVADITINTTSGNLNVY